MSEQPLTLKDCFAQPRGTEGRLFQVPEDRLDADSINLGAYRVLNHTDTTMDIEAYESGGRTVRKERVPISPRELDHALDSKELLNYYQGIGRALAGRPALF